MEYLTLTNLGLVSAVGLGGFGALILFTALFLRRVVPTNEVHIVQSGSKTTSYGKDTAHGNSYYEWPSWIPFLGIMKTVLPVSVFDLDLTAYEAYDQGRLPFVVDVKAFFRISDSNIAAQRVASFAELHEQLKAIVQGAVRTILASNEIEEIMQGRSKFGNEFTKEVAAQLVSWGVETVKNIELMDIRDSKDSHVIKNIMEKKKSLIEMQSRTEVAQNKKSAEIAEITAKQEVDLRNQAATEAVGLRKAETTRSVEIATQKATQEIKEAQKTTTEKDMAIKKVSEVRSAEISLEVNTVKAEQDRKVSIISAEGVKQTTILVAEGELEAKKYSAQAIALEGTAKADAERAMLLAPVEAQTTLAKEIGANKEYQTYLITIRTVEANEKIGIEQAKALSAADIKVISNVGEGPAKGLNSVMDLFSAKGGSQLGAALEGFAATETGGKVLEAVGLTNGKAKEVTPTRTNGRA